jgi:CBS domain-containing protein
MLAKDLMTSDVVTVKPGHSIWHVAQIMLDHDVSGLPVVDDNDHLVGIITEGDLLGRIELGTRAAPMAPDERWGTFVKSHSWKAGDVMTANVVTAEEETPIHALATLMDQRRIRRMPVVRAGKLVGIVSRKDLLRVIAAAKRDSIPPGDDAMRRAILARLGQNPDLKNAQLTVTVSDGIVQLGGTVGSDAGRQVARVTAESIHGVAGVRDHMQVVAGERGARAQKISDQ